MLPSVGRRRVRQAELRLRLVAVEEFLDRERAEIVECEAQPLVRPVPPRQRLQARRDRGREADADRPRRIAGDDRVGGDILGDDRRRPPTTAPSPIARPGSTIAPCPIHTS